MPHPADPAARAVPRCSSLAGRRCCRRRARRSITYLALPSTASPGGSGRVMPRAPLVVGVLLGGWCVALSGGGVEHRPVHPVTDAGRPGARTAGGVLSDARWAVSHPPCFGLGFLLHSASMVLDLRAGVPGRESRSRSGASRNPELQCRFGPYYCVYRRGVPAPTPPRQWADRRRGPSSLPELQSRVCRQTDRLAPWLGTCLIYSSSPWLACMRGGAPSRSNRAGTWWHSLSSLAKRDSEGAGGAPAPGEGRDGGDRPR